MKIPLSAEMAEWPLNRRQIVPGEFLTIDILAFRNQKLTRFKLYRVLGNIIFSLSLIANGSNRYDSNATQRNNYTSNIFLVENFYVQK